MYDSSDGYQRNYRSEPPNKRYRRDDDADPTNPRPSIVVHVRNLSSKATEADLLEALSPFGPIAYASCIPHSRMALVEFEDLEGAKSCVSYAQTSQINVGGQVALFNYSTSHCIERMGFESSIPNKVLVLTVLNAQYPIDADVIYQICAPHGRCLRIAVMHKPTVVQALVEFDSMEVAKSAKHAMNGADIYSGCCTLKVEFAKPESVRVTRQDKDQRDYTLPNSETNFDGPTRKILLSTKPDADPYYGRDDGFGRGGYSRGAGFPGRGPPRGFDGPMDRYDRGPPRYDDYREEHYGPSQPFVGGGPGCVMMVYGLDHDKINCDKLFNILCLYGNVLRINFMRSKVETGIIEMGTPEERRNVLEYCQGFELFGLTLEFKPSHQECVHNVKDPFNLNDGTPSFRDFSASRNQRFTNPEFASKNRIVFPTNVLHWFNAPGTMDEEMLRQMISERSEHKPVSIDVFPSRNERSAAGTVEFATVKEANEVLANVNHTPVDSPYGSNPFIVKWAYATPRRWDGTGGEPPRYKGDSESKSEGANGGSRSEGIKPAYRPSYRRGDSDGDSYRGSRGGYRGGFGGDRGGFGGDRGSYRESSYRGRGRGMSRY